MPSRPHPGRVHSEPADNRSAGRVVSTAETTWRPSIGSAPEITNLGADSRVGPGDSVHRMTDDPTEPAFVRILELVEQLTDEAQDAVATAVELLEDEDDRRVRVQSMLDVASIRMQIAQTSVVVAAAGMICHTLERVNGQEG